MAKRRTLKKNVNYIASELFTECLSASIINPKVNQAEADKVLAEILDMQNEFLSRISHTEPGNVKGFYSKLRTDLQAAANQIVEHMNQLTAE